MNNPQAFPAAAAATGGREFLQGGMTLLDYFSGQALTGM